MAEEYNPEDATAPALIKGFPVEARKLALKQAKAAGLTMGEWMAKAVYLQARADAGEAVLPPPRRLVAADAPATSFPLTPSELRDLIATVVEAEASGNPISVRLARTVAALLTKEVRAARGLTPRKPTLQIGLTKESDDDGST